MPVQTEARDANPSLPPRTWRSTVEFEYTGPTGLTVTGPITGQRYEFNGTGAIVAVDVRDRPHLARVPRLRQR